VAQNDATVKGSGTHDKTGHHCLPNDPDGKLSIAHHAGYWLHGEDGRLTKAIRHICWDGCMFPNAVMMKPDTWNSILASMIAVRDAHGWREEEEEGGEEEPASSMELVKNGEAQGKADKTAKPAAKKARKAARKKATKKVTRKVVRPAAKKKPKKAAKKLAAKAKRKVSIKPVMKTKARKAKTTRKKSAGAKKTGGKKSSKRRK